MTTLCLRYIEGTFKGVCFQDIVYILYGVLTECIKWLYERLIKPLLMLYRSVKGHYKGTTVN